MALHPWKKISETIVFRNPWWTYKLDKVTLPSGNAGEYHYVHSPGSSLIIPVMDDGRILTVKQFRYLASRESIEFPCGAVKEGSGHDETAWRELIEETGYAANTMVEIGRFNPYNGVTNEMCHVYLGRNLKHVGDDPDETEEFELLPLTKDDIVGQIRSGAIWDGMTVAAWCLAATKNQV
jgi:ADP-ribose pyrophosphatase